jgi:phospholipase C
MKSRREFLQLAARGAAASAALALLPTSIRRALAIPAANDTGTINDVRHIVILMQENRSFDHYFGTLRGVRGFGDRQALPLLSGNSVWHQSDGNQAIPPFHLDTQTTSALRVPNTPHSFSDAQAAWNQGKFGYWPRFKTPYSMGYYKRDDIPFQFALAEAFTLCDAHHCSVTGGTDPNRIVFWSGTSADPEIMARRENCTATDSEPDNLRCWVRGGLPEPGYTYQGSPFRWPTIPDILEQAGISWRIYQDPNNNWTGAMHGGLAFESFRTAKPGSPLYEKGMHHWSLEQLARDVRDGTLPEVSWVLPPPIWSEHPSASSPIQGAEFTAGVLDALTANPEVWKETVFFLTFDENDGLFDHVPPPAVPSYNLDRTMAGNATFDLRGEYFSDPARKHLHADDRITGTLRPWGLGPRVPMYVISPWSKGGWVNSQVFDHTSVGQFLEKRFGIVIPGISPWHRVVSGDLTSTFDFINPNDPLFPELPDVGNSGAIVAEHVTRPQAVPPLAPERLFQERGTRPSRALPYELHVDAHTDGDSRRLLLSFQNTGRVGAVFHVYDKRHLDRIPRRYTVEHDRVLTDDWDLSGDDDGNYHLWVYGPNGFVREFEGNVNDVLPEVQVRYDVNERALHVIIHNDAPDSYILRMTDTAYAAGGPWLLTIAGEDQAEWQCSLVASGNWYDFTMTVEGVPNYQRHFAGRIETGVDSISDPAMGTASLPGDTPPLDPGAPGPKTEEPLTSSDVEMI